jgi:hypothetical protein
MTREEAQDAVDSAADEHRALSRRLADAERLYLATLGRAEGIGSPDVTCRHCGATDPMGRSEIVARLRAEAEQYRDEADAIQAQMDAAARCGAAALRVLRGL